MSTSDIPGILPGTTGAPDATTPDVRAAIARASQATGVDFSYLLAQARLESGLDPKARATTSSASGLYQFTNATWAQTLGRHGDALGGVAGLGTGSGSVAAALHDPAQRARLMALRSDPGAASMMAAELAGDNQTALTGALGRAPDASELYLAHFLGPDGATKFLAGLSTDPSQSAAALLPKAAASNNGIFYDASGNARSVGDVMALLRGRLATAMQDTSASGAQGSYGPGMDGLGALVFSGDASEGAGALSASTPEDTTNTQAGGPLAGDFAAAQAAMTQGGNAAPSMADTLKSAFGLADTGGDGTIPAFVRAAYGRMQAMGL